MKRIKRVLAMVLTAAMTFALISVTTFADEPGYPGAGVIPIPVDYSINSNGAVTENPTSLSDGQIWVNKNVSVVNEREGLFDVTLFAWGATYPDKNGDPQKPLGDIDDPEALQFVTITDKIGDGFEYVSGEPSVGMLNRVGDSVTWSVPQEEILDGMVAFTFRVKLNEDWIVDTQYLTNNGASAEFKPMKGNPYYWTTTETHYDAFRVNMSWNNGNGLNSGTIWDDELNITLAFGSNNSTTAGISAADSRFPQDWANVRVSASGNPDYPVNSVFLFHLEWQSGSAPKKYIFTVKDLGGPGIDIIYEVNVPSTGGNEGIPGGKTITSIEYFRRSGFTWVGDTVVTDLPNSGDIKISVNYGSLDISIYITQQNFIQDWRKWTEQDWRKWTEQDWRKWTEQDWRNWTEQDWRNWSEQDWRNWTEQDWRNWTEQDWRNWTVQDWRNWTEQDWRNWTEQDWRKWSEQDWRNWFEQDWRNFTEQEWRNWTEQDWRKITAQDWREVFEQDWRNIVAPEYNRDGIQQGPFTGFWNGANDVGGVTFGGASGFIHGFTGNGGNAHTYVGIPTAAVLGEANKQWFVLGTSNPNNHRREDNQYGFFVHIDDEANELVITFDHRFVHANMVARAYANAPTSHDVSTNNSFVTGDIYRIPMPVLAPVTGSGNTSVDARMSGNGGNAQLNITVGGVTYNNQPWSNNSTRTYNLGGYDVEVQIKGNSVQSVKIVSSSTVANVVAPTPPTSSANNVSVDAGMSGNGNNAQLYITVGGVTYNNQPWSNNSTRTYNLGEFEVEVQIQGNSVRSARVISALFEEIVEEPVIELQEEVIEAFEAGLPEMVYLHAFVASIRYYSDYTFRGWRAIDTEDVGPRRNIGKEITIAGEKFIGEIAGNPRVVGQENVGAPRSGVEDVGLRSGTENVGPVRSGTENVGSGRSGVEDVGAPRSGTENVGAQRSGTEDVGAPRSGTENVGVLRSGTENVGALRSGVEIVGPGRSGTEDVGALRSGVENVGELRSGTEDVGALRSGTEDVGALRSGTEDVGALRIGTEDVGDRRIGTEDVGDRRSGVEDVGALRSGTEDVGDPRSGTENVALRSGAEKVGVRRPDGSPVAYTGEGTVTITGPAGFNVTHNIIGGNYWNYFIDLFPGVYIMTLNIPGLTYVPTNITVHPGAIAFVPLSGPIDGTTTYNEIAARNDRFEVEARNDRFEVEERNDRIEVEARNDRIQLADREDRIQLADRNDRIQLAARNDRIQLANRNVRIQLADRNDRIQLADRKDRIQLADRNDGNQLADRNDRIQLADRDDRIQLADRSDRNQIADRNDRIQIADRDDRIRLADRNDGPQLADRNDRIQLTDRNDRVQIADRNDRVEKDARVIVGNKLADRIVRNRIADRKACEDCSDKCAPQINEAWKNGYDPYRHPYDVCDHTIIRGYPW